MALLTGRLVVLVLVAGLTAKMPPWPLWPQVDVALAAPVTADLGTAPAPEPAGRGVNLLAPLAEGEGRAFSEKPDGTIKATLGGKRSAPKGGGKPFTLNDGEVVRFVDDNSGIDMGADTFAQVVARKKKVSVSRQRYYLPTKRRNQSRSGRGADGVSGAPIFVDARRYSSTGPISRSQITCLPRIPAGVPARVSEPRTMNRVLNVKTCSCSAGSSARLVRSFEERD